MDTEDESKGDDESEVEAKNGEDIERVWMFIVKPVLQKHADTLKFKCDCYKKKGVAPDITKMLALEDIFRLYKADVRQSYEQIVTAMHALEKSKYHKKIIADVYKLMDKGCIYQKALNLSLWET